MEPKGLPLVHMDRYLHYYSLSARKSYFIFLEKSEQNNKFHSLNSQYSTYCKFRYNIKIKTLLSVVGEKSKWMKDEESYYVHVPWTVLLQMNLT